MMSIYQQLSDFVCDYRSRSFTRKYNLQTHIENCHINSSNGQSFPECDLCGRIFTRKQNVMSHMITVHLQGVGPEIRCNLCYKTFTTERNLKRHLNQLHNPHVEYPTCDDCNKVFKGKQSLIAHIQATHSSEKGAIMCHLCEKVYTNNRNLKRHIEMLHGDKEEYKCDVCPKVYTSNQSLKRHLRTTHYAESQKFVRCHYCDKTFMGQDNLESHVKYFHKTQVIYSDYIEIDTRSRYFLCKKCYKSFEGEPLLRQHIKTEHSFKTFYNVFKKCEYCDITFATVYELKYHMRINHDVEYSLSSCNVCFSKFYCKETMSDHRKVCIPPPNVNSCSYCDKLFTDISSLEFHTRIFHPQAQIADSNKTSTNMEESFDQNSFKCENCDRIYYSDRSLKHHIKLKHTSEEAVECEDCGKICSNKYYLASHIKIVHNNDSLSQCNYCEKQFRSKRNIRRHIEYTHLGMQRYKCIECETLFKEKRSLRKHLRTKHPNSTSFPQCHICHKRFESAKSCKIHLKLLHSFNMNTYPCHLCSVSFSSKEALNIHLKSKHLAEDEIYKCEECNVVLRGQEKFEQHNDVCHVRSYPNTKQKMLPCCILCTKDFSTRKTLKRHIKKFHEGFEVDALANFGSRRRVFNVDCEDCLKNFNDEYYLNIFQKLRHIRDSIIFKCETCKSSYNSLEYAIQRYKIANSDGFKSKMILSELCTTEMSDDEEASYSGFRSLHEVMEPESTTNDIKFELADDLLEIKIEPVCA
ncbi:hypothetical protein K1T71_015059 [Dendrolimus kikuchii]|nr:hypothetical protein K1T71_015059 [Dendrolimus kikuchii]